jgi:hypothetical protein
MHVVGCDNCHGFDAVGAFGFGLGHLLEGGIAAGGIEPEIGSGGSSLLRIGRQCARHQFIFVIHARGEAMHGADEGPLPATHHAQPDAARFLFACACDHDCSSSPVFRETPSALRAPPPAKPGEGKWRSPNSFGGAVRRTEGVTPMLFQPQHPPCLAGVLVAGGEVVEGLGGGLDDVAFDEGGTFLGTLRRILEAAFPFQHGP